MLGKKTLSLRQLTSKCGSIVQFQIMAELKTPIGSEAFLAAVCPLTAAASIGPGACGSSTLESSGSLFHTACNNLPVVDREGPSRRAIKLLLF